MEKLFITIAVVVFISWMTQDYLKLRKQENIWMAKYRLLLFIENNPPYHLTDFQQAINRLYRKGQSKIVSFYIPVGLGKTGI